MTGNPMFAAYFFKTMAGNVPVLEWLKSMQPEDRRIIGKDIHKVELAGPQIGKPTVDRFGDGLFEIRSTIMEGRAEARILFTISGRSLLLLHGFVKKSRTTPRHEIELARQRMAEAKRTDQP